MSNQLVLKNVKEIEFTDKEKLISNIGRQPFCQCTNVQQDYVTDSSAIVNYLFTINMDQYRSNYAWLQYDVYPTIKASTTHESILNPQSTNPRDMWRLFNEWTTTGAINTDTSRYTISTDGITILQAGYYRFTLNLYVYNPFRARIKLGLRFTKLPDGGTEAFVGPLGTTTHMTNNPPPVTETDIEANASSAFAASAQLSTIINCSANDQIRLRTIRMAITDLWGQLTYTPPEMSELRCEFIGE